MDRVQNRVLRRLLLITSTLALLLVGAQCEGQDDTKKSAGETSQDTVEEHLGEGEIVTEAKLEACRIEMNSVCTAVQYLVADLHPGPKPLSMEEEVECAGHEVEIDEWDNERQWLYLKWTDESSTGWSHRMVMDDSKKASRHVLWLEEGEDTAILRVHSCEEHTCMVSCIELPDSPKVCKRHSH